MPEVEFSLTKVYAPEKHSRAVSILKRAFQRRLLEVLQQSDSTGLRVRTVDTGGDQSHLTP